MLSDDELLLIHYLDRNAPDAKRWNLSPAALFLEANIRWFIGERVVRAQGTRALNVGIGVGEHDDWLGLHLEGWGSLTSLDIDDEVCRIFSLRQRKEGHPNASVVIHADNLDENLRLGPFDLVTVIGSTLQETGDPRKALRACQGLVAHDGAIFVSAFEPQMPLQQVRELLDGYSTGDVRIIDEVLGCYVVYARVDRSP